MAASAERYARDAALVEADLRSAAARVELARKPASLATASPAKAKEGQPRAGQLSPAGANVGATGPQPAQPGQGELPQTPIEQARPGQAAAGLARNQHRKRKRQTARAARVAAAADGSLEAPQHESLEEVA
jgi:hypothetical protein